MDGDSHFSLMTRLYVCPLGHAKLFWQNICKILPQKEPNSNKNTELVHNLFKMFIKFVNKSNYKWNNNHYPQKHEQPLLQIHLNLHTKYHYVWNNISHHGFVINSSYLQQNNRKHFDTKSLHTVYTENMMHLKFQLFLFVHYLYSVLIKAIINAACDSYVARVMI